MRKYIIWFLIGGAVLYIVYHYWYKKKSSGSSASTQLSDWGNADPYDDGIHGQHEVIEWGGEDSPAYECGGTYYPDGGTQPLQGITYMDFDTESPIIWIESMKKYMINPCRISDAIPMIIKYREDNLK